jgi:molybdopterin converting factor small subunit
MAWVHIPVPALPLSKGRTIVAAAGDTVAEVISNLDTGYPGLSERLMQDGALQPGLALAIDGEIAGRDLHRPVAEDSEIQFIPAIIGG